RGFDVGGDALGSAFGGIGDLAIGNASLLSDEQREGGNVHDRTTSGMGSGISGGNAGPMEAPLSCLQPGSDSCSGAVPDARGRVPLRARLRDAADAGTPGRSVRVSA